MEIRKLYEKIGTDYQVLLERFCNNEDLLCKFVMSFPKEPTYARLEDAYGRQDFKEMESCAHALKGIAANLGFLCLQEACSEVVQGVRQDRLETIPDSYQNVRAAYENIVKEIHGIKNSR